jgi:hypothetical protein
MECLPVEKIPEGDKWTYELLGGHPKAAIEGHLKTGHREGLRH